MNPGTSVQRWRNLMTASRASGRPPLRVLLVLAFVMAAQAVALNHLIGHTAQGDNAHCAICVSAGHAGNAIPSGPPPLEIPMLADRPALPPVTGQIDRSPPAVYRSRAPPACA